MSVVARVDHADGALELGASLDATTVLMVGDVEQQAALIKALRLIALELPFKLLVWQETTGETCLSYTDFWWLAKRYGAGPDEVYLIKDMAVTIDGIARKAGSPP